MLALPKYSNLIHAEWSWWTIHLTCLFDLSLTLLSPFRSQLRGRVLLVGLLLLRHQHAHRPLKYYVELIAILPYSPMISGTYLPTHIMFLPGWKHS